MTVAVSASHDDLQSRVAALEAEVASLRDQFEYAESVAGIKRSLAAADRGEGRPLHEVDTKMRAKYNIPRS